MGQAADATTSSRNGTSNPGQPGPGWVVWGVDVAGSGSDAAHGLPDLPCTWGLCRSSDTEHNPHERVSAQVRVRESGVGV